MVWEYKWDEWFLYDDDDILRAHVYYESAPEYWCWLVFDLEGNVKDRGKELRTAEIAKLNVKRSILFQRGLMDQYQEKLIARRIPHEEIILGSHLANTSAEC